MTGAAGGGRSSSRWRDVVRHRSFRRLWLGDAVSLVEVRPATVERLAASDAAGFGLFVDGTVPTEEARRPEVAAPDAYLLEQFGGSP